MANNTANPNISEIQTKNGSVYDVAAKRFSGNRNIKFEGDVTAQESGWDGSGEMKVTTTISEGAVGESKIDDGAVTNAKVADGAINWDKIAASVKNGTIAGNYNEKLATCAQVKTYVDEAITGHGSYLGQKTVAQVNALTGMNNGDHVSVSDSGSITNPDGSSTSVNAGDNVIYDGTLRKWDCLAGDYKVKQDSKEVSNDSNIKTVDKVTQNENGEVSVTFKEIGKVAAATAADKATKDASGNTITSTYATKSEVDGKNFLDAIRLTNADNIDSLTPGNNCALKLYSFRPDGITGTIPSDIGASTECYLEYIARSYHGGNFRVTQNLYSGSAFYYYTRNGSSDTWTPWTKVYYSATSTYSATGTQAVNGTAVASALTPIEERISEIDDGSEYGVTIGTRTYKSVKIGNQLWMAENLDEELGTLGVDEWYYNGRSGKTRLNTSTTLTRTISSNGASDVNFALYDGAERYIVGKPVFIHFDVSISTPVNADLNIALYFKYGSSYYRTDSFTIQSGNTSVTADASISIPANADLSSVSCFIRLNCTSAAFQPSSTVATVSNFRIFQSSVDGGADAITYEQALANEETAKANNYGRLYTWSNVNANISKLGLSGWRWATKADFEGLVAIDSTGKKFRAKTWNSGTDDFGFSILPTGQIYNTVFSGEGVESVLSASDERTAASIWSLRSNRYSILIDFWGTKERGHSIRLVLDLNPDGSIPDNAKSSTKVTKQNALVDVSYDTANHKLVQTNSKGVNKDIVGASELWAGKDASGNVITSTYATKTDVNDKSNLRSVLIKSDTDLNNLKGTNGKGGIDLYHWSVASIPQNVPTGVSNEGQLEVRNANNSEYCEQRLFTSVNGKWVRKKNGSTWSEWVRIYDSPRKSNDVASFTTDDTRAYTGKAIAEYVNSVTQELTAYDVDALWNEDGEATAQSEEG